VNLGKRGVDAPVDLAHAPYVQARWIDTIDAAGAEQVTFLQVCTCGHKAQLQRAAQRERVACGDVALARAGIEHRDVLVAVGQQRDLTGQRVNTRDLTDHPSHIHHGRTQGDARELSLVDDDVVAVGLCGFVEHLHRFGETNGFVTQSQQLAQVLVFLEQLFSLLQPLGLGNRA
jgi:hypothetical protein